MTHRALVIGYGSIGAKRARILHDFGWHVTIWEPDASRRLAARAHGFTNVRPRGTQRGQVPVDATRAGEADVVFVCTPPKDHALTAAVCLSVGCHVFIEKPIAHTVTDARLICKVAAASDRHVMVGCNYRFWGGHKLKPETIHALDITMQYHLATVRPDWRDSYVNDPVQGGVVLDSGVHAIDLAAHLAGPIDAIANVYLGKLVIGALVEEDATIHLRHKNGVCSHLRLSLARREARCLTIETKTGHRWHSELWDGTDGMFERETREFLRCVKNGKAPPNGPEEATETLRWCIEARDMVREGLAKVTAC